MNKAKFYYGLSIIYMLISITFVIVIYQTGLAWEIIDFLIKDQYEYSNFYSRYYDTVSWTYYVLSFLGVFVKASFIWYKGICLEKTEANQCMKGLIISFVVFLSVAVAVVLFLGNEKDLPENHTFAAKFDKEDIVGTWEAEWQKDNHLFYCIMTIRDDGTYESKEYKNGIINEVIRSGWRVDNWREVTFYIDEQIGLGRPFLHENGVLTYGGIVYRKLSA